MTRDLRAALGDIAADAGRVTAPLSEERVLTRRRRRRAVRRTAASTVAAVLVGGAALGTTTLLDRRADDPLPAVSATITPRPTPTTSAPAPTPAATAPSTPGVVLPTGDATLPFGVCGSLSTAAPAAPVDDRFAVTFSAATGDVRAGANIAATGSVAVNRQGAAALIAAVPDSGPRVALVRDGVVVGTAQLGADGTPPWRVDAGYQGGALVVDDWLPLTVCAADGHPDVSAGAALPAGDYELVPWAEVVPLGSDEKVLTDAAGRARPLDDLVAAAPSRATAVGEAVTLTVGDGSTTPDPVPGAGGAPATLPTEAPVACGDPTPATAPGSPLRLEVTGPRSLTPDTRRSAAARLVYTGPGRVTGSYSGLWAAVVRDGVVVAAPSFPYEGEADVRIASGLGVDATGVLDEWQPCDPAGTPLAAGTYQVVLMAGFMPDREYVPGTESWAFAYSEPLALVIP